MKKYSNLIEVTKLIDENLMKLENLKKEKEKLMIEYNLDKTNQQTLNKIKELEEKYIFLLQEAKQLNEISKKLSA